MPRGGARPNSGPRKGAQYRPRLKLQAPPVAAGGKVQTSAQRHRAQRDLVASLVAQDLAPEDIAVVVGVPVDKLRAAFATELEHGHAIIRGKVTAALLAGADDGNMPAVRRLEEMTAQQIPGGGTKPVGKKAAAAATAAAAVAPGNRFATRPAPKLVINNNQ